ncbi:MAG TPA: hypothetical protein VFI45_00615 [Candidatus Acidoferrum sp.]|nr:hypothetical protein [Candidatus Acidoferrum sp.]
MPKLPPLATLLMFGTSLIVAALVGYRLLWAASSLAGAGLLPRRLQRWRQWLHGETADKKII